MKRFSEGDGINGRCGLCGVEVREPLPAGEPYDPAVADAAVQKVVGWIEAHYATFHPDHCDPFEMTTDLKEGP